ncbi:MAG: hypothetical protein RLY16_701 [Bacteroidota bacterium]
MAKKTTYRQKFDQQNGGAGDASPRKERVPINPNIQLPFVEGKVILIDKPLHWTSFDMVRKLRGILQIKKIGHAGTLDPLATGLLIICTGKFTKKINEYMASEKEYTGTITLGATTPTYDLESIPENFRPFDTVTLEQIQQACKLLTGDILQAPPVYSAIKKDGVASYELARRGEAVALAPRPIHIEVFEITTFEAGIAHFRVVCSTGTYIRSLAHDLGQILGCGAHLSALRRTRIGEFWANDALSPDGFAASLQMPTI